jgi:hypothetical protein
LTFELFAPDFVLLALAPDVLGATGRLMLLTFTLPLWLLGHGEPPEYLTLFILARLLPWENGLRANGENHWPSTLPQLGCFAFHGG